MKEGDKPAYPQTSGHVFKTGEMEDEKIYTVGGLTKREYLAAKAMQALIMVTKSELVYSDKISEAACKFADALLKELGK